MTLSSRRLVLAGTLASALLVVCVPLTGFVEKPADLSGEYTSPEAGMPKLPTTLKITQTADSIEITRTVNGNDVTSKLLLDGTEAPYKGFLGFPETGTAKWKGKDLVIKAWGQTTMAKQTVQVVTEEKFRLSDANTLKIAVDADAPDIPPQFVAAFFSAHTEVFTRVPKPQ